MSATSTPPPSWHPGDREFDLFVLDGLEGVELQRFREHMRGCEACTQRLQREARQEMQVREGVIEEQRWWRRLAWSAEHLAQGLPRRTALLIPAAAAAAALLAVRSVYLPQMRPYDLTVGNETTGTRSGAPESSGARAETEDQPKVYSLQGTIEVEALPDINTREKASLELLLTGSDGKLWRLEAPIGGDTGTYTADWGLEHLQPRPQPGVHTLTATLCPDDLLYTLLRQRARCQSKTFAILLKAAPGAAQE